MCTVICESSVLHVKEDNYKKYCMYLHDCTIKFASIDNMLFLHRSAMTAAIMNHIKSLNWGHRVQLKQKYKLFISARVFGLTLVHSGRSMR